MGGAEGKVAFIDTEGTFRPERHRLHTIIRFMGSTDSCIESSKLPRDSVSNSDETPSQSQL